MIEEESKYDLIQGLCLCVVIVLVLASMLFLK